MTRVDFDIEGVQDFALDQLAPGLQAGALYLTGEVKGVISQQGTGRAYRRGEKAVHIASAPGKPPASDTGRLLGSILPLDFKRTKDTLTTGVGANTDYAVHLELGTEKMAPRPFMESTLSDRLDAATNVIRANIP
jgi:HK97 gp10 family phage protein